MKKNHSSDRGMTLIETLVALTILTVAIVAPMALTMQSLSSAYYARDQVISSNLAQEAIEGVRAIRDGNILRLSLNQPESSCNPTDLLCGIPRDVDFTIDVRTSPPTTSQCSGSCPLLQTDGNLYGYSGSWTTTNIRRTVRVYFTDASEDEITVQVTVDRPGNLRSPAVVLYTNLYRWLDDDPNATPPVSTTACSDSDDNDGDGLIDMSDPGCSNSSDNDEVNTGIGQSCDPSIDPAAHQCGPTLQCLLDPNYDPAQQRYVCR